MSNLVIFQVENRQKPSNNRSIYTDILKVDTAEYKQKLPINEVPTNERYRLKLLTTLLEVRETKQYQKLNSTKN